MKRILVIIALFYTAFLTISCGNTDIKTEQPTSSEQTNEETSEVVKYTVTFDVDGSLESAEVVEGEKVSKPLDPVKDGYKFLGWYDGEMAYDFEALITADVTLKAKFEEIKYVVTFDVDGELVTSEVKYNEKVTKPLDPVKEGYEFLGWYAGETAYDFETIITGDITLVAKYEIACYTVIFIDLEGNEISKSLVEHGKVAVAPDVEIEEGYILDGWYNNSEKFNFTNSIYSDITLILKLELKKFIVTFVDQDNSELKKVTVEYGKGVLADDLPVVEGFELVNMDKDISSIKSNLTVFCEFKQVFHIVIHDLNGEPIEEFNVLRGQKITKINYEIPNDSRFTYTIKDWYKDKELTETFKLTRTVTMDMMLYPKVIATPIKETYEGMTISILGDSISTFYSSTSLVNSYYSGENQYYYPIYSSTVKNVSKTWWHLAISSLNLKLGINNSWSGSSAYGSGNSAGMSNARINTLGNNGTPDIIVIFLGTNDNVNGHTKQQVSTAFSTMFKKISEKYPDAYVLCCTLGYAKYDQYYYTEEKRNEYNEVIRDLCTKNKAKVIEIADLQTESTYSDILGDRLHPNAYGMERISEKVVASIKDFFSKGIMIK